MRSADVWCAPITGFRALAAVAVAVAHSFLSSRTYPISGIVQIVGVIVPMFFVVSAYALYRPFVVEQIEGRRASRARDFWWRRFLRIYPLYAVALTAYLVLLPPLRPPGGGTLDYIKLFSFLQVYDPDLSRFSGIPAAWFLCDEVAFYLMIPGLAWIARRIAVARAGGRRPSTEDLLRGHATLAGVMWVIGFTVRPILVLNGVPAATALPVSNLDFYGIGILICVATLWERAGLALPDAVLWVRLRPWVALAAMAAGALGIQLAATDPADWTPGQNVLRYVMWTVMTVPAVIFLMVGDQRDPANRWMGQKRWVWLGALSLHVYLWHQLLLGALDRYGTQVAEIRLGPRFLTGLLIAMATAGGSIVLSAALRPVLDWPHDRFARSRAARPARPVARPRGPGPGAAGRRRPPAPTLPARPGPGRAPGAIGQVPASAALRPARRGATPPTGDPSRSGRRPPPVRPAGDPASTARPGDRRAAGDPADLDDSRRPNRRPAP